MTEKARTPCWRGAFGDAHAERNRSTDENRRARLFKRHMSGSWLDGFHGLEVLDCGFVWRRTTGLDNLTWRVFGKTS